MTSAYRARLSVLFLLFCCAYALIILNLYVIQIKNSKFFVGLAEQKYHFTVKKSPPRASIIDRNGPPLANNKEATTAFILPNKLKNKETLLSFLQMHFPEAHKRLQKNGTRSFMFIKRKLNKQQIDTIADSGCTDIRLLHEPNRFYPVACATPVIGMTNIDNNGLFGLERLYNTQLTGTPTTYALSKDARSGYFYFKKETTNQGTDGIPVQVTLDGTLQFLAHEELAKTITQYQALQGAVIIMEPTTGDILAMVVHPFHDPNKNSSIDPALTKNSIVTDTYEFGSVIKTFATLAALDEQVVTPDELIDCQNKKTGIVAGRRVNTVKAHGVIPFADVVAVSNNIGIATVSQRLGPKLYDHYRRVGFGTKTGIRFAGEQAGFVNPPARWSKHSIISLSYGYEVTTTLLQLASAFCLIANNGFLVTPQLIRTKKQNIDRKENAPTNPNTASETAMQKENPEVRNPSEYKREYAGDNHSAQEKNSSPLQSRTPQQLYSTEVIQQLKKILQYTTQRGTTRRTRIKGYNIMSKTGTANLLVDGAYRNDKNIFTCAGIIEKDGYTRVMVTFINQSSRTRVHADTVAVPLFERIAERLLIHERVV